MERQLIFTVTNDLTYDQRMQRICSTLSDAGYEVTLVGRRRPSSVSFPATNYKTVRLNCWTQRGKLFYIEFNLRLLAYLLFAKASVFCAIDLDTVLANVIAGKLRNKKLVFDAHEWFTETPEVERRPGIRWIWLQLSRICIPRFDAAYTVADTLAEKFSDMYKLPFQTIRNMPLLQEATSTTNNRTVLYQGALNEGRGLTQLILAMHKVDANLVLAGEGDLSSYLRKLVEQEHLSHKVRFVGFLLPAELRALSCTASVGVNLLDARSLSYYYSLANKFFDYVQATVPQIGMRFPEYEKLNTRHEVALLIQSLEPAEIAQALNKLLTDETFYSRLKENGLTARQQWNWQQESQKLIALYESLCR